MRLHILAGCRELLLPEVLAPELAAGLIGPQVRFATASWLSGNNGNRYHCFLQDEPGDRRTKVMALALKDDFGNRFEPLLVLPDLLDESESEQSDSPGNPTGRRSQLSVLSEIWNHGSLGQVTLYGLAITAAADPEKSWAIPDGLVTDLVERRIGNLRTVNIAEMGVDDVHTQVIEVTPEIPVFETLYHNAICNQVALRLMSRLHEQGWILDQESLTREISNTLSGWNRKGVAPPASVHAEQLDAITDIIHEKWF